MGAGIAEAIEIEVGGTPMPARLYRPDGPGPHPGIILLGSEYGAMSGPQNAASSLSRRGFAVLIPELFFRERNRVLPFEASSLAAGRIMRLSSLSNSADESAKDSHVLGQLSEIADFMCRDSRVNPGGVALIGVRLGARFALMLASRKPELVSACIANQPIFPLAALKYADGLQAPLRLIFAEKDEMVNLDLIDRIRAQLDHLGKNFELTIVPGVDGNYMIPDSPSYDSELFQRGQQANLEWLEATLL